MKNSLGLTEGSDFLTDFTITLSEVPGTVCRLGYDVACSSGRVICRSASKAWRWIRGDKGQFALILAMAAIVVGLQLRSLL